MSAFEARYKHMQYTALNSIIQVRFRILNNFSHKFLLGMCSTLDWKVKSFGTLKGKKN